MWEVLFSGENHRVYFLVRSTSSLLCRLCCIATFISSSEWVWRKQRRHVVTPLAVRSSARVLLVFYQQPPTPTCGDAWYYSGTGQREAGTPSFCDVAALWKNFPTY
ncbi:hypothetical protein O9929_10110 [Vibrio lentus]|nr:hypothetical protein [Vibrio lentus]